MLHLFSRQPLCPGPTRSALQSALSPHLRGDVRNPRGWTTDGSHALFHHALLYIFSRPITAPGIGARLLAAVEVVYATRRTSMSTSSAAKHFKQCKFNEQQSNSVPEGTAFFSIPNVSTGSLILLSESCLSSPLPAGMWHRMSLHILSEWLFLNLLAWSLPGFQRHSEELGY